MTAIATTGLNEIKKAFMAFNYVALDSSATIEDIAQTGPQSEISGNGASRKAITATQNGTTGDVTLSGTFTFTGDSSVEIYVRAICFLNAASVLLARHVPIADTLPSYFKTGGLLIVEATCTLSRPA